MKKAFTVSTRRTGHLRRVRVVVYDTADEMRAAARKYHSADDGYMNAIGLSQPQFSFIYDEDGAEKRGQAAGVVRLVREEMGAAVLAHEMTHMALAIYREDSGKASLRNMKNEETLCHIVSDLVRSANHQFWKAGIYQQVEG